MTDTHGKYRTGPDLVLIDDDPIIRDVWLFEADIRGLRLLALADSTEIDDYDLSPAVPVYIDVQLSHGVSGLEVAQDLSRSGFRRIALTSGHQLDNTTLPDFIAEVVGKEFPVI